MSKRHRDPVGPLQTLRARQRLDDFFASGAGEGMAAAIAEVAYRRLEPRHCDDAYARLAEEGETTLDATGAAPEVGRQAARRWRDSLRVAGLYWVSADMGDLAMHAARSRESGPVRIDDMPAPHGFVWFEREVLLDVVDSDGTATSLSVAALTWSLGTSRTGAAGASLTYWSSTSQRLDAFGKTNAGEPFLRHAGPLVVAQSGFLEFGVEQEYPHWWEQFAATLWQLMEQQVVSVQPHRPSKQLERVLRRKETLANTVNIVTLRHARVVRDEPAEPSGRHLTVRYLRGQSTGGYWQTVHHGPGKSLTKRVWVLPHMVGPEGAPIVFRTDTIYAWRR